MRGISVIHSTDTPGQSNNESRRYTPQSSRTGASPPNIYFSVILRIFVFWEGVLFLYKVGCQYISSPLTKQINN